MRTDVTPEEPAFAAEGGCVPVKVDRVTPEQSAFAAEGGCFLVGLGRNAGEGSCVPAKTPAYRGFAFLTYLSNHWTIS